jgi:hypothetical protein
MCRSIKQLRDGGNPASDDEIEAAALQFVRKISGFRKPAPHNEEVFEAAVKEISASSRALLESLIVRGNPASR